MAPHKALLIPDILHEIFKHLAPCPQLSLPDRDLGSFEFPADMHPFDPRRDICKTRRLTLARAARTCKAFTEPASRVLWEVLDEIEPILSVLRTAQTSAGQVNAAGWARFEDVCRRVRALSFTARSSEATSDMLSLIFSHQHQHHDDGASFKLKLQLPNLRALQFWWEVWADKDPDPGQEALLLKAFGGLCASPSLVLLSLPAVIEDQLEILDTIAASCTPGQLLHFRAPDIRGLHVNAGRVLGPFTSIQTASLGRIDQDMLRILGSLPNLQTLEGAFAIDSVDGQTTSSVGTKTALFPALRELTTSDQDSDHVHLPAILSLMSSDVNSLTVLSLHICTESSEGMLGHLDDTLSSPALASLQELSIRVEINRPPPYGILPWNWHDQDQQLAAVDDPISFADVFPLLKRLPALRRISLGVEFRTPADATTAFDVRDDDLAAVAATWPDLAQLTIVHSNWFSGSRRPATKRPSLSALVALAGRCRKLERVDMEFDSVSSDEVVQLEARDTAASTSTVPQTALRWIVVDIGRPWFENDGRDLDYHKRLRVAEPSRVAAALRKLFPNLRSGLEDSMPLEEQEYMNDGPGRHYLCWEVTNTDPSAETDSLRLLKALDEVHPQPSAAANINIAPRDALGLRIMAVMVLWVTVMVARLTLVQDLNTMK